MENPTSRGVIEKSLQDAKFVTPRPSHTRRGIMSSRGITTADNGAFFSEQSSAGMTKTSGRSKRKKSPKVFLQQMFSIDGQRKYPNQPSVLDPFSPSFKRQLILSEPQKRLPSKLPQNIRCERQAKNSLNRILQGCDYALFGDPFRMDEIKLKQRYTHAANNNFDKAFGIMKEFDYAEADMLEVLYQYKIQDLDNIKQEQKLVTNEYKSSSKQTSKMLTQINSKMMRAKKKKKNA